MPIMKSDKRFGLGILMVCIAIISLSQAAQADLDENCIVNILNRTIQVDPDGGWSLPNIPSNQGRIRARATCIQDGKTISGQSNYFNVITNGISDIGDIYFDAISPIPVALSYRDPGDIMIDGIGATIALQITATYPDGKTEDVSAAASGINYNSSNPAIATVAENGLVSAVANGNVLITARKDGIVGIKLITVVTSGDSDNDGLPDNFERQNGLNPNDPIDAMEDQDNDGLSALNEFNLGTDLNIADSDGDGLSDGDEVNTFGTIATQSDSDNDGLNDGIEITVGSDPNDKNSADFGAAIVNLNVTPSRAVLNYNTIDTESSLQFNVTATLIDGGILDVTDKTFGTTYESSELTILSFSAKSGEVFAGESGEVTITIDNNGHTTTSEITVRRFDPIVLSAIDIPGYANNVDAQGQYAYVAAGSAGLQIVDVSDPSNPKIAASLDTDGTSIDVQIVDDIAYLVLMENTSPRCKETFP